MFSVWENVLAELKKQVPSSQFATYLSKTSLVSEANGEIRIGVPNVFMQTNVRKLFNDRIVAALRKNRVEVTSVEYVIVSHSTVAKRAGREVGPQALQKLAELKKRSLDNSGTFSRRLSSTPTIGISNLNPKFTMDNFVVGANNDLAVAVARNIIDNPGEKYNPFFLYGGPGLGKTHLVEAIGNALLKKNPDLKVLYTPIHHFYQDFVDATRQGKMEQFAKKYKQLDVFIVDDFQFIVGKEKSQVEFFDIFNDMHLTNKQVIITSDRLPSQIQTVDERLASRLTMAGAFDIQMPGFEDRCAILKSKAEFESVEIEDAAIEYIAETVNTNIRDLEGMYGSIIAMADLKGISPLEVINSGFSQNLVTTGSKKTTNSKRILEKVAKFYGISVEEMVSRTRVAHIKNARQVAMYFLSEELKLSTTKVASEVGLKDHTTVMHGIRKIKGDMKMDLELREQLQKIRESIYA